MKTALIVDVSNLYFAVDHVFPGRRLQLLEYVKLLEKQNHNLFFKICYSRQSPNVAQSFTHMLHCHGFETHFGSGPWAVEIALRVSEVLPHVDSLIIGSNSRELHPIFKFARKIGKVTKCFACNVSADTEKYAEVMEVPESILVEVKNASSRQAGTVAVPNNSSGNVPGSNSLRSDQDYGP